MLEHGGFGFYSLICKNHRLKVVSVNKSKVFEGN